MNKLYLCDRNRCGNLCLYPECQYTTDISHAVNAPDFQNGFAEVYDGGNLYIVEKELSNNDN